MNKNDLRRLAGLETLKEEKWSADVKEKKHPPEGLFANGSVKSIVEWLQANHGDYKSAMSSLNFYINRSGKNLIASRKAELEKAKNALRRAYGIKESFDLELIRKMAGLPAIVAEEDEEHEDAEHQEDEDTGDYEKAEEPDEKAEEHEDDLPTVVKKIAAKAVGKSEEELEELIDQVYKAGFEDGKAQAAEPAEEEKEEDEKEEE